MAEIKLTKRYPHSRAEDITDAFMRGYQQGCEDGYKKKEFDSDGDCFGCKYIGLRYIEGATPRCEGCCRNYADGYVAEQTENSSEKPNNCKDEPTISKMDQVEEPQSNADQRIQDVESVEPMQMEREGE